ncbi:MAG: PKD domain-containing protein, partial [bacterium]
CSKGRSPMEPGELFVNSLEIAEHENEMESGEMMLGVYDLNVSGDLQSAEIVPVRKTDDVGDSWVAEMTYFFTSKPCGDCLTISGVKLTPEEYVSLLIRAKHPFDKGDSGLPPGVINRDDVRVFDPKLVVVDKNGSGIEFPALGKTVSSSMVKNADGYTDMIDEVYDPIGNRPNDTHPYIILFENPTEGNVNPSSATGFLNLANASGHNVMNQGGSSDTELILDIPSGENVTLRLYLTASYGQSAADWTKRLEPKYYIPEFNAKEAWKVDVIIESNSLGPGYTNSMAELKVKVWDWQQGATVDPSLSALDRIRSLSDVIGVDVEVPVLFSGVVTQTSYDLGGTGQNTTPLEYRLEIYNELAADSGTYPAIVRVLDSRNTGENVSTPEDGIRNSGFGLVPFEIPGFRTYQYFEINITNLWNVAPVARFTTMPGGDPLYIGLDEDIHYDATTSYDVDGGIVSYEWDFKYDGDSFNPTPGHTSATGVYSYSTAGTYRIALKVTDATIPVRSDITYKYAVVLNDPSLIEPRLIAPVDTDCYTLRYTTNNPIRINGLNVYIPVGGYPYGERYILVSNDYGSNFSAPIHVSRSLESNVGAHVGGFDVSSGGDLSYQYFDYHAVDPLKTWIELSQSDDGFSWPTSVPLESNTYPNYIVNSDFLYGANDREFIFFEMLNYTGPGRSSLNYFHRESPAHPFQDISIEIDDSAFPPEKSRYPRMASVVDDSGNVHLGFTTTMILGLLVDYYGAFYCRLAPDGSSITRQIVQVNDPSVNSSEKWIALDVKGNNVYLAFQNYLTFSQSAQLTLCVSNDGGETWNDPVPVSDNSFPGPEINHDVNIAVDPGGTIHFVWTDNRQSEIGNYNNIWYSYSSDGGQTFSWDVQLYGDDVIGDQQNPGIAIDDLGRVHVVWWNNDIDAGRGVWHTRFTNL